LNVFYLADVYLVQRLDRDVALPRELVYDLEYPGYVVCGEGKSATLTEKGKRRAEECQRMGEELFSILGTWDDPRRAWHWRFGPKPILLHAHCWDRLCYGGVCGLDYVLLQLLARGRTDVSHDGLVMLAKRGFVAVAADSRMNPSRAHYDRFGSLARGSLTDAGRLRAEKLTPFAGHLGNWIDSEVRTCMSIFISCCSQELGQLFGVKALWVGDLALLEIREGHTHAPPCLLARLVKLGHLTEAAGPPTLTAEGRGRAEKLTLLRQELLHRHLFPDVNRVQACVSAMLKAHYDTWANGELTATAPETKERQ
jgi:hypothetical protein